MAATPQPVDLPAVLEALAAHLRVPAASPAPAAPPAPRYLSVPKFAERAGVSATTVRAWIKDGMPHTNAPGHVRVIVADAERWIELGPGARPAGQPVLSVVPGGKP